MVVSNLFTIFVMSNQNKNIMAQKTFKIGEYCKGGVITAMVNKNVVVIIGKEWDTSAGFSKGSNQSNAKEFTRISVNSSTNNSKNHLREFLNELTTSYYSETVLDWVMGQGIKFNGDW